jgi:mRNA interferase MazF
VAERVKRGDIVLVAPPGDYGKPRPAVVIQSDRMRATDSLLLALMTSALEDAPIYRLQVEPSSGNSLKRASQIMIEKILAMPKHKIGQVIGRLSLDELVALNSMLSAVVGLAD